MCIWNQVDGLSNNVHICLEEENKNSVAGKYFMKLVVSDGDLEEYVKSWFENSKTHFNDKHKMQRLVCSKHFREPIHWPLCTHHRFGMTRN